MKLVVSNQPVGKHLALLRETDEELERIASNLDDVIKFAGITRAEIRQFIRRKFYARKQPFASLPPLEWKEEKSWAIEPLRAHIIVAISRIQKTSEEDKYVLIANLYGRVRDRMQPKPVFESTASTS